MSQSVSVIVPCYNAEAFVGRAVSSALRQTLPPIEIVCVDDGSTDGTLDVLRALESEHDSVRVLTGPNGGPSVARNRGLAVAVGTYVQFLDADDRLDPAKLAHQVALVEEARAEVDLVAASAIETWDDGKTRLREVGEDAWASLVEARLGTVCSNLWRRESVVAVGGWREGMHTSEDPELMFRMLQAGAVVQRDDTPLTTLHRRPVSQWHADYERSQRGWFTLRRDIVEYLTASGLLTEERRRRVARVLFRALDAIDQKDKAFSSEMHALVKGAALDPAAAGLGALYKQVYRGAGFRAAQDVRACWRRLYWLGRSGAEQTTLSDPASVPT